MEITNLYNIHQAFWSIHLRYKTEGQAVKNRTRDAAERLKVSSGHDAPAHVLKVYYTTKAHVLSPGIPCRYSPLHNVPQPPYSGPPYPAVLLLTADHDDRVVPLHTLKYCAALQHGVGSSSVQRQPLLVRVDTRSGHGAGKPTSKAILEDTHIFSFIAETLGLSWID